jgi:hypothetical protein
MDTRHEGEQRLVSGRCIPVRGSEELWAEDEHRSDSEGVFATSDWFGRVMGTGHTKKGNGWTQRWMER